MSLLPRTGRGPHNLSGVIFMVAPRGARRVPPPPLTPPSSQTLSHKHTLSPPPARAMLHVSERGSEAHVNGHCDREHMTLHLWAKIIRTSQPFAIITIPIRSCQSSLSLLLAFYLFFSPPFFLHPQLNLIKTCTPAHTQHTFTASACNPILMIYFCSFYNLQLCFSKDIFDC